MQNGLDAYWAKIIIDQLIADNHNYFCISPGSRSTPLILAIQSHPQASPFIHFDERSLAFHALGYAKAEKHAPVIVVTSGTACGNLLPAIMESYESSTPLIILTADRPLDLQDSGANQTTRHQPSLFKNFVCYELNLPSPEASTMENLRQLVHRSSYLLKKHKKSIHINCSFREPFDLTLTCKTLTPSSLTSYLNPPKLTLPIVKELSLIVNKASKGVILLGSQALKNVSASSLQNLTKRLNWPIFSDALSLWNKNERTIFHYNLILKHHLEDSFPLDDLSFDCVLHIGASFVSKQLPLFLKKRPPKCYIHVHTTDQRFDPTHLVTHKLEVDAESFSKHLIPHINPQEKKSIWFDLDIFFRNFLTTFFSESKNNSEAAFFWYLGATFSRDYIIFIGNSMPIRDLSDFFFPKNFSWRIYANRGLSGIDGNLATATGLSFALSKPCIVIIGDQTFLHDATSISLMKASKVPLKLIVLNNSGGQIFSHLPISQHKTICQKYFVNPSHFHMIGFAQAFEIPFYSFTSVNDLLSAFEILYSNESCLIELRTCCSHNLEIHHKLSCLSKDAISSFFCSV